MLSIYICLVLHLLAITHGAEDTKRNDDSKMLLMVQLEPVKDETRPKRTSATEGLRKERQSLELSPEYYGLLQQLAAQQQQQQQTSVPVQQQQDHLIQPLAVARDGDKQTAPTRFVFSPEGSLLQENLSNLGQTQQYETALGQTHLGSGLAQPQQYTRTFTVPVYVQPSALDQTGPQTLPQAPTATPRPGTRPRISEFARQQQRLLQEYRDAPLRSQIAGLAAGPQRPRPAQPVPTGPLSQSPQVFVPAGQTSRAQPSVPTQLQDPKNSGLAYTTVPVDQQLFYQQQSAQFPQQFSQLQPQHYAQLPQQQYVQLPQQFAAQYAPEANQVYTQTTRTATVAPPVYYQQPEAKVRAPTTVVATSSAVQPQYVPQSVPQQYLIETTKPSAPQQQYIRHDIVPQVQYAPQPILQPQPVPVGHDSTSPTTLLQPVAGKGFFTPTKSPSRSSIYVSRSSVPKTVSLTITDPAVSSEKVPVVRLQSPTEPRLYTKQELDALVRAGYVVTPIQDPKQVQYLKPKRQPQQHLISEERTNHVLYENPQDGIQYQYSPGTSDSTVTIKTKKSITSNQYEQE